MGYLSQMFGAMATISKGMAVTAKYLFSKPVTFQYPDEKFQVPERFRGELFMNVQDCIGCLQCARACPVNCIYIETVKRLDEDVSQTATGQKLKLWLTQFDIDVSLCMVCGLCSEVCPTDCLYHTHVYEVAPTDRRTLLRSFIDPAHLTKAADADAARAKAKAEAAAAPKPGAGPATAAPKPAAAKPAAGATPAAPTPEELRARMLANKARAEAKRQKDQGAEAKPAGTKSAEDTKPEAETKAAPDAKPADAKPAAPTPEELRARMLANKARAEAKRKAKKEGEAEK